MVSQHEISTGRNYGQRVRSRVGILGRNVVLTKGLAVDVNMSVRDTNLITGNSDHALDKALARIAGIAKHHNVSALDAFPPVNQFVDEDAFLVFKAGLHASAFHFHRLIDKQDDEKRNQY